MTARLFANTGALRGLSVEVDDEAILGRSRGSTVQLQANLVSGQHARLRYDAGEGCYVLEDLESLNGTALDGVPVERPERLGHLHVITFAGEHDVIFQDLVLCAERHAGGDDRELRRREGTDIVDTPLAVPAALAPHREQTAIHQEALALPAALAGKPSELGPGAPDTMIEKAVIEKAAVPSKDDFEPATVGLDDDGPRAVSDAAVEALLSGQAPANTRTLVVHMPGAEGGAPNVSRFPLTEGEHFVGRDAGVSIRIASMKVSRRHAVLTVTSDKVTVHDLGSRNRTWIDGQAIEDTVEVRPGARLCFGEIETRLIAGEEGES